MSGTDQQELYHCPNCSISFKALGSLINHLESESCGAMRFDTVQRRVRGLVAGNRLLGY